MRPIVMLLLFAAILTVATGAVFVVPDSPFLGGAILGLGIVFAYIAGRKDEEE